jgi:hypothetical protein
MGYYINPKNCTKEQYLAEHARQVSTGYARDHIAGDDVLVCLVDNGPFTAAAIAHDDRERDAFMIPDHRPKKWYAMRRAQLQEDGFLS